MRCLSGFRSFTALARLVHDLKRLAEQVLRFGVKPVYAVVPAKPGYLTARKLSGCRRGVFDRIVQSIRRTQRGIGVGGLPIQILQSRGGPGGTGGGLSLA